MSEQEEKPVKNRRAASAANTAAYGLSAGLGVATLHWLLKGFTNGEWEYEPPDDALVEMWLVALLPTFHLIGKVVNFQLSKFAGERNEDS